MRKEKTSRAGILSRMFAAYARDAEPEEIAEAADTIQEIAAEPVATDPDEAPKSATEASQQDDGEDILGAIMSRLEAIEAKLNATDEEPEEDPLEKFQTDLEEAANEPVPPQFEQADEEEEVVFPQDEQDEEEQLEAHYADPEVINEQDEDVDEVIAANNNEPITADCRGKDRRAIDATRAAIRAVKPFINSLPADQRRKAADVLVKNLRKASGLDASSKNNGYLAIKKARRTVDSEKRREADKALGEKIMAKRNINAKK